MVRTSAVGLLPFIASTLWSAAAHAGAAPALEWEAPLTSCFPADVVLDDEGRSYVACHDTSTFAPRVVAIGPDGAALAQVVVQPPQGRHLLPVDLAWAKGTLYISASSLHEGGSDAVFIALSTPSLEERWRATRRKATASSVATAPDGGPWFVVTQSAATLDVVLLGFDPAGAARAEARYDSGQDDRLGSERRSLAIDSGGSAYVAADRTLLHFSPRGSLLWRTGHPSYAVAVDAADNVLVTSPLSPDGQTSRFAPDGTSIMHVDRGGFAVAPTPDGGAWLGGTRVTDRASAWDLQTTLLDRRGRVVFADRYDGGYQDRFVDLAVDGSGDAYVLASSYVRSGLFGVADRYLLLKLSAAERRVWSTTYGRAGLPAALALTDEGRIVATGHDGTASWVEEDALDCAWWWPSCWVRPGST